MDRHSFYPLFLLTILMVAVGQMTQTLYVPSIPMMAGDFNVASGQLQAVMACYLIPYGLSQFVYGPLSDRIGRRPVLIVGMMVFLVGTLIIQVIPHFAALLVGSFIQGLGTGAGGAMSRTVMRDRYNGAELNRANSLVSMGVIFSPLLARCRSNPGYHGLVWRDPACCCPSATARRCCLSSCAGQPQVSGQPALPDGDLCGTRGI